MRNTKVIFVAVFLFSSASFWANGNTAIFSFAKAKRLAKKLIEQNPYTFYCNCRIKDGQIDRASCGYVPRRENNRANRIEWEHVVPAENFGRSFVEWREGHEECIRRDGRTFKGRLCARKVSSEFRRMEADLYNLYPAIGELNGDRSNYRYGIVDTKEKRYGACEFYIEGKTIEPRRDIRGDIARVYFYMDDAYPKRGILGGKMRRLMEAWDKEDPVDKVECLRASLIAQLQGNENRFVSSICW
ncbi:MAG: Extracellular deoxyribonuclease [Turneriella sp.]|nr:Extracellular deoxyribonuclease [Turneriella sp.]